MVRNFILHSIIICLFLSSCTMILSTNVPGKPEQTLPKEWLGKYEILSESYMPSKRDSVKPEKQFATIESTRVIWESDEGTKIYSLKDSLRYSVMYGQGRYLSLLMPQGLYAVFRVTKVADTLQLRSLSSDDEPKKSELNRYFDKVEKLKDGGDEYYRVTIVEKKLDAFYKSSIPSKDVTRLVLVK